MRRGRLVSVGASEQGFRRLTWRDRLRLLLGAHLELCITSHRRVGSGEVTAQVNIVDARWGVTPVCSIGTSALGLVQPEHDVGSYQ